MLRRGSQLPVSLSSSCGLFVLCPVALFFAFFFAVFFVLLLQTRVQKLMCKNS
jgi:hypothetical protein